MLIADDSPPKASFSTSTAHPTNLNSPQAPRPIRGANNRLCPERPNCARRVECAKPGRARRRYLELLAFLYSGSAIPRGPPRYSNAEVYVAL